MPQKPIMFADEPESDSEFTLEGRAKILEALVDHERTQRHQAEAALGVLKGQKTANIFGLPITVSSGASDTLAAVYMMFQMLQGLFVTGGQQLQERVVIPGGYGEEEPEEPDTIDMSTFNSLSPTGKAEWMRVHGVNMEGVEREADPTAAQVKDILREAGIPTEPGPGGAWAPGTVVEPEGGEE